MDISLPTIFQEKLAQSPFHDGIAKTALHTFGQWFTTSRVPFFPDYTDHGPQHLSDVLHTSAALLSTSSKGLITAQDVTALTLAILLHDSALHLSEAQFKALIKGAAKDNRISEIDIETWPALWERFMFEAHRWDDRKLAAVFGDEFVANGRTVHDPFQNWDNLSDADKKLVGEFIRLHHPRLAHEFAVYGLPDINGSPIQLPAETESDLRSLAGIIARSHGLPLRTCIDFLSGRFQKREDNNIHAVYLMAILRIADFLQIQRDRAPSVIFRYRIIPSRVSVLEHKVHNAIRNITTEHEDPECLDIRAEPPDVETYLRLREWLDGLQAELDVSWAVIGETYGRFPNLQSLGLRLRRIRSNLDEPGFLSECSYLPMRVRMEVARSELLLLLIRPLYGNDPRYGIRELVQNAVDAVKEREYLERNNNIDLKNFRQQSAEVVVRLGDFDESTQYALFEIADRGVGMTEKVVQEYFLKAGASYRTSDEWKRLFEGQSNAEDTDGVRSKSRVSRTGRFGVGTLAAFLLGTEVEVETRHFSAAYGLKFRVGLNTDPIQIDRLSNLPFGTRILIRVPAAIFNEIPRDITAANSKWDWYLADSPRLLRFKGDQTELIVPFNKPVNFNRWRKAETNLPLEIQWEFCDDAPNLTCNGIFIADTELPELTGIHSGDLSVWLPMPKLHIVDPDGWLPLNLARTGLTRLRYGFEAELCDSIMKDYIARFLMTFPEEPNGNQIKNVLKFLGFQTRHSKYGNDFPGCIISKDGFCLAFSGALKNKDFRSILYVEDPGSLRYANKPFLWDCVLIPQDFGIPFFSTKHYRYERVFRRLNNKRALISVREFRFTDNFVVHPDAGATHPYPYDEKKWRCKASWIEQKRKDDKVIKHRWLVESVNMPPSRFHFEEALNGSSSRTCAPFIAEFFLKHRWDQRVGTPLIDRWWKEYFGDEWIPWKMEDRRAKFAHAYERLSTYIGRYEQSNQTVMPLQSCGK